MFPCGESFSFEKEKEWPSEPALAMAKYRLPGYESMWVDHT